MALQVGLVSYGLSQARRSTSGITRYTLGLIEGLLAPEMSIDLTLLGDCEGVGDPSGMPVRLLHLVGCHRAPGLLAVGSLRFRNVPDQHGLQVVHDPAGLAPFALGVGAARTVVTVHDVFAWSCPGNSTAFDTLVYRYWLPRVLARVDAIITVSQRSRDDIVKYLHVPANKVAVTYEGVRVGYRPLPIPQFQTALHRLGLAQGYILFVGSVERRKNVHGLLRAYARLRQMGEQRLLVVVGVRRSNARDLPRHIQQLGLERHVVFAGYVPDVDLPAVYNGADLFVFPSLYEGFGLPPLEAMACGTPVICSNNSSLPEVVGDAAITVDPYDVEALAEAMRRVLSDAALREEMRAKGLARAKLFTWNKTARETVAVYEQVLEKKSEMRNEK